MNTIRYIKTTVGIITPTVLKSTKEFGVITTRDINLIKNLMEWVNSKIDTEPIPKNNIEEFEKDFQEYIDTLEEA